MGERKTCTRCGEEKTLTDFHKHRRRADGRQSWCKTCMNSYMLGRYYERKAVELSD